MLSVMDGPIVITLSGLYCITIYWGVMLDLNFFFQIDFFHAQGALTHGDRRATGERDLSRFNIDNKYGRAGNITFNN
jgi:hypothetical protein